MANRVKEVSAFDGTSWGAAVPLGADDSNVDITSSTTQPDGSAVSGVSGDSATALNTSAVTVSEGDTSASAWTKFNRFRKRVANNFANYIQGSIATSYNATGSNSAVYSTSVLNNYMSNVIGYSGTTTPSAGTVAAQLSSLNDNVNTAKIVLDDGTVIDDDLNTTYLRIPKQLTEFTFEQDGKIWRRMRASVNDSWGERTQIATESMFNRTNCNAVFFGDSWTVGTGIAIADRPTKRFSAIISKILECTEYNYGVGASGFIRTGNLISSQITTASTEMTTAQKQATGVVVIVGGVNDYRQQLSTSTVDDFVTGVINTATLAHTTFPNAIIVLGIGNTNLSYFPQKAKKWYQWAIRAANAQLDFPHLVIHNLYNVISGLKENYASDNLHPNELGHARFGGYIANAILGGGQNVSYYIQDIPLETNFTWEKTANITMPASIWRENDEFIITPCAIKMNTAVSSNTKYGLIPEAISPSVNMYGQFYNSNQITGAAAITASGNLYINPTKSVTSGFISPLRWFFGKEENQDES